MYETFCKKQRNYGPGNISVGSTLETTEDKNVALTGLWFRKNDKIQRLLQLVVKGQALMRLVKTSKILMKIYLYMV